MKFWGFFPCSILQCQLFYSIQKPVLWDFPPLSTMLERQLQLCNYCSSGFKKQFKYFLFVQFLCLVFNPKEVPNHSFFKMQITMTKKVVMNLLHYSLSKRSDSHRFVQSYMLADVMVEMVEMAQSVPVIVHQKTYTKILSGKKNSTKEFSLCMFVLRIGEGLD